MKLQNDVEQKLTAQVGTLPDPNEFDPRLSGFRWVSTIAEFATAANLLPGDARSAAFAEKPLLLLNTALNGVAVLRPS